MNIPYLLFGKSILRQLKANELRPPAFTGLDFSFIDHDGNEYYSWPDVGSMPPIRVKEIESLMVMVDSGRGDTMMKEVSNAIIDKANDVITGQGKAKDAAAAAIAMLAKEMVFRREKMIPEDAYYALAATCCARKDEDPRQLDRVTHAKKIETFMAAGRAGDPFFLASDAFKMLLGASLSSADGYLLLRIAWTSIRERHRVVLKACV